MNPNDTNDIYNAKERRRIARLNRAHEKRRAARARAERATSVYVAMVVAAWDDGDVNAFDAPAPE